MVRHSLNPALGRGEGMKGREGDEGEAPSSHFRLR